MAAGYAEDVRIGAVMFGIVRFVKPTRRSRILLTVLAATNFANGNAQAGSFFCFSDVRWATVLSYIPKNRDGYVVLEIISESIEKYKTKHKYSDGFLTRDKVILRIIRTLSGESPGTTVSVNQNRDACNPPLKAGDRGFMIGKLVAATDQNITFVPRSLPISGDDDMDTHK